MQKSKEDLTLKRSWLIKKDEESKIEDYYEFNQKKKIGSGTYGSVVEAIHKKTKAARAIKIIRKKKIKDKISLVNEIRILKHVDHRSIVRLYQIFETQQKLYLVMQMCSGGELIDMIMSEEDKINQDKAKRIFAEIVAAVYYCHERRICHRDLKPQNILLMNKDSQKPQIKIIDFGLSAIFSHEDRMKTLAGTIYYVSPEVLKGQYDQSCDVWSLGVILFALIAGRPPFDGQTEMSIADKIKKYDYTFEEQQFKDRSDVVKDLITRILQPSQKRMTCKQILNHPWLKNIEYSKHNITMTVVKKFKASSKLKIIALSYLATQLDQKEIQQASKVFKTYDKDRDGHISLAQLSQLFQESNFKLDTTLQDITEYLQIINTSKDGKITYNQFLAATMRRQIYENPVNLKLIFDFFDKNKKGVVTFNQITSIQGKIIISKSEFMIIVKAALGEQKGELNFEDFSKCIVY